jgi:superkiller protein 3
LEEHVRMNVARVCFKLSDWTAAQSHYAAVQPQTFESLCGVAVAAYKCGLFADSYSTYQSAMGVTSSQLQKSHVLTAMASIAYRFQGADAAKTLLFQSCQQRPPSVPGLLALCALGIKQGEMALVQAAMTELAVFENEAEWATPIAFVKATMSRLEGTDRGLREIARQAHRFPQVASLWALLAQHVIDTRSEHNAVASLQSSARFALKSVGLERQIAAGGDWPGQHLAASQTSSSSHLVVLSHLLSSKDSSREARVAAAKAVHARPHESDTWCLLVAASKSKWTLSCCEAINEAERTCGADRDQMKQWIDNAKRIILAK